MTEDQFREFLEWRGIEEPCKRCGGSGNRVYGSTSTWRGGMGGASMTADVCDHCWGTGDESRHGVNLRAMLARQKEWGRDQCVQYFAQQTGCTLGIAKGHMRTICEILEREERRRKTPFDHESNGFWWRQTLRMVSAAFRRFGAGDEGEVKS